MHLRPRILILIAAVVAALVVAAPPIAAMVRPQVSDTTSTLNISPDSGPPGTAISVSGTCVFRGVPSERAFVRGYKAGGNPPFDFYQYFPVASDGAYAGDLVVPSDAPAGAYGIELGCSRADTLFGDAQQPFTVTPGIGPSTTTTTTATTTPTTTTTTAGPATTTAPVAAPPDAPPASVVPGQAHFTG
ncbi:MAG: hypothetical protein HYX34_11455 [Actinobacteria bacterium]|nr:hypothetical protein [Actinomycetota bacterium]